MRSSGKHIGGYDCEGIRSEGEGSLHLRKKAGALYRSLKDLHPTPINLTTGDPGLVAFEDPLRAAQKHFKKLRKNKEPGYASGPWFSDSEAEGVLAFLSTQGIKYKSAHNVLPLAGVTQGLSLYMQALYRHDNDAIVMDTPNYGLSLETSDLINGELFTNPLNRDGTINIEGLEKLFHHLREDIPERKIMYYLSSPHNPTGDVVQKYTMKKIAGLLDKYDVECFHDVAYWGLQYSNEPIPMMATFAPKRTVTGFTCSKFFGMPNQRAAFITGPDNIMEQLTHQAFAALFSVSDAQKTIAATAFSMDPDIVTKRGVLLHQRRTHFLHQRNVLFALVNGIDAIAGHEEKGKVADTVHSSLKNMARTDKALRGIGAGLKIDQLPKSGFFALLDVESLVGSEYQGMRVECAEHVAYMLMKETGVLFLPGGAMLAENKPAVLRISFSVKPKEMIKGIEKVREFLAKGHGQAKG